MGGVNPTIKRYVEKFNQNDEELIKQDVPNSKVEAWMVENVPEFHCTDKLLEEAYYFRWWVFRKHIKTTPEGRIITEFLPKVYWSGPYNSINCAAGHHVSEARWLKQGNELIRDYINFWFKGSGDIFSYSTWVIDSLKAYAIQWNDQKFACNLLPELIEFYEHVEKTNMTRYGLFWSYDDRDAMEMSISGSGLRPTLNSYMYANAQAIAYFAELAKRQDISEKYHKKATNLKAKMLELLWDSEAEFFKVVPQQDKDDEIKCFDFSKIDSSHNVREQIGYIPWAFGIAGKGHNVAWQLINDSQGFKGDFGPTTAERSHPDFNKNDGNHECLWNGPSWPFATTQTLNSMICELSKGPTTITTTDFFRELRNYAGSFYRTTVEGERVNWLDENIDPDNGEWLSRRILEGWGWPDKKGGYERGKDYNHSAFNDLIIRGLCGVSIVNDGFLKVKPLTDSKCNAFSIKDLPIFGHNVTIQFNEQGLEYKKGCVLLVQVDEKIHVSQDNEIIITDIL